MCALIDVAAANIGLEVLIAGVAGAAERPDRVGAGSVSAAEGQSVQGKSEKRINMYCVNLELSFQLTSLKFGQKFIRYKGRI